MIVQFLQNWFSDQIKCNLVAANHPITNCLSDGKISMTMVSVFLLKMSNEASETNSHA